MYENEIFETKKGKIILLILCVLTGLITGLIVSFYRIFIKEAAKIRMDFLKNFTFPKIVLGLITFIVIGHIIQWMYLKYPKIEGGGLQQVRDRLDEKIEFNWIPELFYKFWGGVLGILVGMSFGRGSLAVHLGALVGDGIGKIFKTSKNVAKYIMKSGISAGLSASYNAPLAGIIFTIEEFSKELNSLVLMCIFLASVVSSCIMKIFIGKGTIYKNNFILPNISFLSISISLILFCVIIVVLGKVFSFLLEKFKLKYKKMKINLFLKITILMIFVYIMAIFFKETTGGGSSLIAFLIEQNMVFKVLCLVLIFKYFYTIISIGTGFPGGTFFPLLAIGALIGKVYGLILVNNFNFPSEVVIYFILLGMATYFTVIIKRPITAIILVLEMTGSFLYLYSLMVAVTVTYIIMEILKFEFKRV